MHFIGESAVRSIINEAIAFEAAELAFRALSDGAAAVYPTLAGRGIDPGTAVNIKFSSSSEPRLVGFKAGTFWPNNAQVGLPNHNATTVLLDDKTGAARAIVSAGYLNRFRTAAADAVATNALARPDSSTLAIVGTGGQAAFEVRAIVRVRPIRRVLIGARSKERGRALAAQLADLDLDVQVCGISEAAHDADIIVTATNAREVLVARADIRPGAHCSAMGADAKGKQEFQVAAVAAARVFADAPEQAVAIGELQHAFAAGELPMSEITGIGDVLTGRKPGRRNSEEITFFDSSGLAVQDLFAAKAVLDVALERGLAQAMR